MIFTHFITFLCKWLWGLWLVFSIRKSDQTADNFGKVLLTALCVSLPGTVVSSVITAAVFGGITSSGSSLLVQLLHAGGLGMTASVCVVQAITDYLDRIVIVFCTVVLYGMLPASLKQKVQKGNSHGTI